MLYPVELEKKIFHTKIGKQKIVPQSDEHTFYRHVASFSFLIVSLIV